MDESSPFSCASELLEIQRPAGDGQTSLRNIPLRRDGILAKLGRTRADEIQVLIPHSIADSGLGMLQELSELLRIERRMLVDPESGGAANAYTCLTASPGFDRTLFGAICDELIREMRDEQDPAELMSAIVDEWSDLLSHVESRRLSKEAIIGLFGELICLEALLGNDSIPAVESWLGPEGHRHDFVWTGASAEIKSTVRTDGLQIRVHDADQLTPESGRELHLVAVRLEWNPGGTSLTELIRRVIAKLDDSSLLLERLKLVGIPPGAIDEYSDFRLRVIGAVTFRITDEFPAITLKTLAGITEESRITQIAYSLNLTGYAGAEHSSVDAAMWRELLDA